MPTWGSLASGLAHRARSCLYKSGVCVYLLFLPLCSAVRGLFRDKRRRSKPGYEDVDLHSDAITMFITRLTFVQLFPSRTMQEHQKSQKSTMHTSASSFRPVKHSLRKTVCSIVRKKHTWRSLPYLPYLQTYYAQTWFRLDRSRQDHWSPWLRRRATSLITSFARQRVGKVPA